MVEVDGRDEVNIVSIQEEDGEGNVDYGRSELAVGAEFGRVFGELSWGSSQSEENLGS